MARISDLPVELLRKILIEFKPHCINEATTYSTNEGVNAKESVIRQCYRNDIEIHTNDLNIFTIMKVCNLWRDVMIGVAWGTVQLEEIKDESSAATDLAIAHLERGMKQMMIHLEAYERWRQGLGYFDSDSGGVLGDDSGSEFEKWRRKKGLV